MHKPYPESPEPKLGDILLFSRPRRKRDWVIRWVTHSKYFHCAIYAGDWHVIEARPKGVARNDLRGREHGFVTISAPEGKGEEALNWVRGKLGEGFDQMDMVVILLEHIFWHLRINYTPRGKYTCAELVVEAFRNCGVPLCPGKPMAQVVPDDFSKLIPAGLTPGVAPNPAVTKTE